MRAVLILIIVLGTINILRGAEAPILSFSKIQLAENRLVLKPSDFSIISNIKNTKVSAKLLKGSFQWVRFNEILPLPRAIIAVAIDGPASEYHIKYNERSLSLQQLKSSQAFTEFYVSLFQSGPIIIFHNNQKIGELKVVSKKTKVLKAYIDYSCAPFDIKLNGVLHDPISIGCHINKTGPVGEERVLLEVLWSTARFQIPDQSKPPYSASFLNNHPVKVKLIDPYSKLENEIEISAQVPKRNYRLKTAIGFGPYSLSTKEQSLEQKNKTAPSLMLYGKLDIKDDVSFRFFDALVKEKSLFNNLGFYYAYDLANTMDNRLNFTALLGLQSVQFKYNKNTSTYNDAIFPQGIEVIYKHAFGFKNYSLILGGFVDPANFNSYQNLWVRYGKKYFWELNYIIYENNNSQSAKMFGLSVGVPFLSFF